MNFTNGMYVSRFFYLEAKVMNVFGVLFRRESGGTFSFEYRFRYVKDGIMDGTSKDEKNFYVIENLEDETAGLKAVAMFEKACRAGDFLAPGAYTIEILKVESDDVDKVIGVLKAQPWAHVTMGPQVH